MARNYDCIVLGLGGIGSAVLYELARRGADVAGVEQFGVAHDLGSSHGQSRMIRRAYFEHPNYVPLVDRAYEMWAELEQRSGQSLFQRTGLLLSGPPDDEHVLGTLRAAEEHGVAVDSLPHDEARRRFPHVTLPPTDQALYEPEAGTLWVERCVRAHLELAKQAGAELRLETPAHEVSVSPSDGSVRVATSDGDLVAPQVVCAAGAWTLQIMEDAQLRLEVRRKLQLWHPIQADYVAEHESAPSLFCVCPHGTFYTFPSFDGGTMKVAQHSGGALVDDPSRLDRAVHPADIEPIREFLQTRLPFVGPEPSSHATCMYTMSPDGHFIVDRHPRHEQILLACGFSGHGFKFAPVLGEAVADLVLGGSTALPVEFWRINAEHEGHVRNVIG